MRLGDIWNSFWQDECGLVISTEAALVGTVGVLGAAVGLSAVGQSVNDELKELAFAFRSLDQSYSIPALRGCGGAWTAGAEFIQQDVERSLEDLCDDLEQAEERAREEAHDNDDRKKDRDADDGREDMKRKGKDKKKTEQRKKRDQDRRQGEDNQA